MHKIKLVVFDLDGTLIESSNTIYKTTKKTLEVLSIHSEINKLDLDKRIGEHFQTIFNDLNVPVKDIEEFIEIYKTIYFDFIDESIPYPNIEKILEWLKSNNYLISLLTTKAQEQADAIINHFNYNKYFDLVFGRRNGLEVKPSPEPLLFIANSLNNDIEDTMIVGDTELDIQCGKAAGSLTCAVSYGYRTRNILEKENPNFIIDNILELKNIMA
ncbi:MAG: HAD family hydrolase [Ignavibacterium sp.]